MIYVYYCAINDEIFLSVHEITADAAEDWMHSNFDIMEVYVGRIGEL
jgi:hypothetical protein